MHSLGYQLDAFSRVVLKHRRRNFVKYASLRQAENFLQQNFIDLLRCATLHRCSESEHLFQQRLRIAHAAVSLACQQNQRSFGDLKTFAFCDRIEPLDDFPQTNAAKIVTLATRKNSRRQAMRFGGRENKFDRWRRFFQSLQQRVERIFGDLVNFIDDVNLKSASSRLIADIFDDLANLIDAAIRRTVDFENVDRIALGNLMTLSADATRSSGWPIIAIPD